MKFFTREAYEDFCAGGPGFEDALARYLAYRLELRPALPASLVALADLEGTADGLIVG